MPDRPKDDPEHIQRSQTGQLIAGCVPLLCLLRVWCVFGIIGLLRIEKWAAPAGSNG